MIEGRFTLPLRLTVASHPQGVAITMQRGSGENVPAVERRGDDVVFDFEVMVDGALPDGRPRFLGPFTQGPPPIRFVYTRIGTAAGDPSSPWSRRAKIPLMGIDWAAIESLKPGQRLEASYQGTGPKGDPTCASVKTLSAWTPV
jgi:hypothetical protein